MREPRRRIRAVVVALAMLTGLAALAAPAAAGKKAQPPSSGVVERFETRGGHGVGPLLTEVGGTMIPVFVQVGWDDAVAYCTGAPPVVEGVEQDTVTPSGNVGIVVHNEAIPVLVFDVSGIASEAEFLAKCGSGELQPLAQGTVKQRPIINVTDTALNFKVKSRGVVEDATDQKWVLQTFIKVRDVFATPEPEILNQWIKLTPR